MNRHHKPQVASYQNLETMLKQPLILRLLKSRRAIQPIADNPQSTAVVTNAAQPKKSPADLGDPKADAKPDLKSDDAKPDLEPDEAKADAAKADAAKTASSSLVERLTLSRIFIGFGILAGLTGLAFTRDWPAQLQTSLQLDPAEVPLRKAGDPSADSGERVADLFLTHQIFYRKLEAIAGAAIAPTPDTTDAKGKPAAQPAPEKVTAAAPPAPAVQPPDFSGTTIDSVLEMRVAVAKDVSAVGFATSNGGTLADLDGNSLKTLSPETASLAEINGGIVVDGEAMPSTFWIYPDDGGYVAIGSSWYRGRVLVALRERGLIAVNYVLLGDYLYSVVGSEMSSSWAIESLKAQAVAARSYALTHNIRPASEAYFDLDNTPRFQAYTGIGREDSVTQAAVLATAGEFISHQGGIVESLYAASQDIVDDAHSGSGMSQLGAKDLAEQGYSYQEILGHYYPGTALGRIETEND